MPYHYDRVLQERIWLSEEESKIINLPEFQRLKFIKQNGFAYVKYPDATNSRFDHSIGTVFWVTKLYQSIFPNEPNLLDQNIELRSLRLAALLHDIGHGPFSHVFENLLERNQNWLLNNPWKKLKRKYHKDIPHELVTLDIINKRISNFLDKDIYDMIINILTDKHKLSLLLSGDLDADRLDYMTRDSHYSGLPFGFNIKVIFNEILEQNIGLEYLESKKYFLCIKSEGVSAFEQYLVARYAHYKYIAYEPTILKTNLYFTTSLEEVLENNIKDTNKISNILYFLFTKLNDDDILNLSFKVPKGKLKNDIDIIKSNKRLKIKFEKIENNNIISENIKLIRLNNAITYHLLKIEKYDIRFLEQLLKNHLKNDIKLMPYLPSALALKTCVDDINVNKDYNPLFLYDYSPILQGLEQKMFFDCGVMCIFEKKVDWEELIKTLNIMKRRCIKFDYLSYGLIEFLSIIYKKYPEIEVIPKVKRTKIIDFLIKLSQKLYEKKLIDAPIKTDIYYYSAEIYNLLQKLEYLDVINEDFNVIHQDGFIPTYVYSKGEHANDIMNIILINKDEKTLIEQLVGELLPRDKSWWEL